MQKHLTIRFQLVKYNDFICVPTNIRGRRLRQRFFIAFYSYVFTFRSKFAMSISSFSHLNNVFCCWQLISRFFFYFFYLLFLFLSLSLSLCFVSIRSFVRSLVCHVTLANQRTCLKLQCGLSAAVLNKCSFFTFTSFLLCTLLSPFHQDISIHIHNSVFIRRYKRTNTHTHSLQFFLSCILYSVRCSLLSESLEMNLICHH